MTLNAHFESLSFGLVEDLHAQLCRALDSLGGRPRNGLFDAFLGYSSIHINRAAAGYVCLRRASMIDASKLLVRPAIEAMIRILAVRAQPDVLYRIALEERRQRKNLIRPVAVGAGLDFDSEDERQWQEFRAAYIEQFPHHTLLESELSLEESARIAGLKPYYDRAYRFYCKYTHGALSAVTELARDDSLDNRTMAHCAFCAVDTIATIGGDATELGALRHRLYTLDDHDPAGSAVS